MDTVLFHTLPLKKKSLLQKIFNQQPDENAIIDLNNLFASKQIINVTLTDIHEIEMRYRLKLNEQFYLNLEEFYAVVFNEYLKADIITDDQFTDLKHLKSILKLAEKTISFLHLQLGKLAFKERFEKTIADGIFNDKKEKILTKFAEQIDLPKDIADTISANVRTEFVKSYVRQIIDEQRFSPEEEERLERFKKDLEVDFKFDKELHLRLQKLKQYWALEHLPLPILATDIILQKNEQCHLKILTANWYELRVVRQNLGYSSHSASIKIAKGFYLRTSSHKPRSYTSEQMKLIDSGSMYLTNKRIIFMGKSKNSNIRLEKVISFTPYNDGVEIYKDAGKSPLLKFSANADLFCIILGRLLNDNHTL